MAYRAALEESTRARVPPQWAMTQQNLGNALETLGTRESGTTRLQEAVAAHRAALEERTRARVPYQWAMTQFNLGNALGPSARARAEQHGWRRRSRPTGRRSRNSHMIAPRDCTKARSVISQGRLRSYNDAKNRSRGIRRASATDCPSCPSARG